MARWGLGSGASLHGAALRPSGSEIVLDEDGNIQKISMSLGKTVGFVTLRVAD